VSSDLASHFVRRARRGVNDEVVEDAIVDETCLLLGLSDNAIAPVSLALGRDVEVTRDANPRDPTTGERLVNSIL
jgi:hypothetical protein